MKLTRLAAATGIVVAAGIGGVMLAAPAIAYPSGTVATASINSTTFPPGGTATVTVQNATPGGTLTMYIASNPVQIATGSVVGKNGTGSISGAIPAGFSGNHTISVNSTAGESFSFAVVVTSSGSGGSGGSGSGSGSGLASTGAAVTGIGILGAALVAGGVFFVMAGRRRENASTEI